MAWITPKTNWNAADGVSNVDMNRIESNIQEVFNMAQPDLSNSFGNVQLNTTTTAAQMSSNVTKEVVVQADPTNTANIMIGNSAANCTFALLPGSAISLPVTNTNLVFHRAASGTQKVNFLWRG